jgi:predicted anti-sigma-YlaC factor YlaD
MMHRIIRDHLEQVLAEPGSAPEHPARKHLAECEECRDAVNAMREQAAMLRNLRTPAVDAEPRPGFYARVLERIELQTSRSVYELFFDSLFARRIAMASLALALLLGVYVISSEQMAEPQVANVDLLPRATLVSDHVSSLPQDLPDIFSDNVFSDNPQPRLVTSAPDQDAVLVNLVTYREQ